MTTNRKPPSWSSSFPFEKKNQETMRSSYTHEKLTKK
jgi:hypothetical protein